MHMRHETRVNLKHLLEDIRDSYSTPIEEVIITELIANALDSGATRISFFTDSEQGILRCVDNGRGMSRRDLGEYHNIAATTKERGRGIGFAGIGAKLSLLVASRVITESHGPRRSQSATEWRLEGPTRAPWNYIKSPDYVESPHGTAIALFLLDKNSSLSDALFIQNTIQHHFFPLLDSLLKDRILRYIYPKGVELFVNDKKIDEFYPPIPNFAFQVKLGKASRRPVGFGYIMHADSMPNVTPHFHGIMVSTYGKTIRQGWEWIGLFPKSHEKIYGIVEVPGLAEILTTNKSDFLQDAGSLKKYYRYRKAIQEGVLAVLRSLGEDRLSEDGASALARPFVRKIESALDHVVRDFPELEGFFGVRRQRGTGNFAKTSNHTGSDYLTGISQHNEPNEEQNALKQKLSDRFQSENKEIKKSNGKKEGIKKSPGIKISFEEFGSEDGCPLGRMVEDTIFVNTLHPFWQKAKDEKGEEYCTIVTVSWVLSDFLEEGHSSRDFMNRLLYAWAKQSIPLTLFSGKK
ncbi:MAG: hypothetical protein A3A28_00640 [Candidatus Sungbacteria bacterium RIFCSPLOWO2_01_FULL_47_32]|uniref:Histidine kinase/HSP90-like ATPase domain-containing protein n=1 Tax=Candidatus Sungbacteria bacterium RIFCSPHIGHO2_01_FULL_47_32 TaxID=1802264 RepID=A0A1G2K3Q4_9BACT|nr:MAG: hypothetical protein UX72_C0011G0041 [Parcubacteria group bacterium GW2011_GWA2_47_10]OGZ94044.1 MAG: hypothetical protein A2633_00030 [Candidatus Sungbacteria bacterium RIFCSPHIGHO2_01_FULL_47_32]OGZ99110.1 MAG: hypothetical protein A3D57_00745 [Candidatus Sungbacteria bacterium RIFCSPHIGHO2_02_FULL_46_12]OHA04628.1 MAG: hypothetical protein A3A28_00640 [Candidatus Sungbacteria bacterium RIFCSPLOWO2_01_FULL_47_32]